jgi:hypothetical protein
LASLARREYRTCPEKSLAIGGEALALAERIAHPFSLVTASPESSSSGKGLSEAARSGSKSGEKGEKASPLRGAGGMLVERSG